MRARSSSGVLATLQEASQATDYLRGLYSLKYEILGHRDSKGGENLEWFTDFHVGNLDGAMDAVAAHVGRLIHRAKAAIEGEEAQS